MPASRKPTLLLVTPYLSAANNGNWRTAARWQRLLSPHYRVIVQAADAPIAGGSRDDAVAMVALHARRSHTAIAAWRDRCADRPLLVVLTGTDLYRDLPAGDGATQTSMTLADRLIVLQGDAPRHVPGAMRGKTHVVFQSARALAPWARKHPERLHCVLVAHLREEKDPATVFAAWRRLPRTLAASLSIIGGALDASLGDAARALAASDTRVQWLGPRPHPWTRQAIKRAHVLLVPSRMEGGANVVVEAITAGTPVIGSKMSGNVGMLGDDYPGWFDVGDAAGLAACITGAVADRRFLDALVQSCARRAPLFSPEHEARSLRDLIDAALRKPPH